MLPKLSLKCQLEIGYVLEPQYESVFGEQRFSYLCLKVKERGQKIPYLINRYDNLRFNVAYMKASEFDLIDLSFHEVIANSIESRVSRMSGNDVVHILAFFERYWESNDGIEITHDMIDAAFTELTSRAWALFDYMNSLDSKIESVIKKRKLGNDFLDTYHKEIYLYKYIMMIIMCIHHGLNKEPKEIGRQRNYLNMEVVNKLNSTAYGDTILISGEPVKLKRVQLVVTYEKNGIETSTSDSNIISFH